MEQRKSPWEILGIPENSADDVAKSAWKKLVIKCHPDKVAEELKAEKEEEFKQVNEAFKTITDPELRKAFEEAQDLRKRMREAGAPRFNSTPSRSYNTRTAAPPPAFTRAETWDSGRTHHEEDRYYSEQRASSRKYDGYESQPPSAKQSSRPHRSERERRSNDEKVSRSERRRARDRDEKRDRSTKFAYVDDDSDERGQYEESYHRRSEEHRARDRYGDDGRRSEDEKKTHTRSHSDLYDERTHKYYSQEDSALDYINRHRSRPESSRVYVRRGSGVPEESSVRRSSARRESGRSSGRKDSKVHKSSIEVVDFPSERRPSTFHHSASSPTGVKASSRAQRTSSEYDREDSARPSLRRSETLPPLAHLNISTSSRRKDSIPTHSSKLRSSENIVGEDSGYSSPTTPDVAYQGHASANTPATSTKYYYSSANGGVNKIEDDDDSTVTATPFEYTNGHRTVLREPESGGSRRNSTSPIRPSASATRPVPTARYTTTSANASPSTPRATSFAYATATVEPRSSDEAMRSSRPGLHHANTSAVHTSSRRSPDRDREQRGLYREVLGEDREEMLRSSGKGGSGGSFSPDHVSVRRKFTPDDIKYGTSYVRSGRDRGREAEYFRPAMTQRTATFAGV